MSSKREPTAKLWISTPRRGYYIELNFTELGEKCHTDPSTISRYFSSHKKQRRVPSLKVMACLAKQLDLSLDQLAKALEKGAEGL